MASVINQGKNGISYYSGRFIIAPRTVREMNLKSGMKCDISFDKSLSHFSIWFHKHGKRTVRQFKNGRLAIGITLPFTMKLNDVQYDEDEIYFSYL